MCFFQRSRREEVKAELGWGQYGCGGGRKKETKEESDVLETSGRWGLSGHADEGSEEEAGNSKVMHLGMGGLERYRKGRLGWPWALQRRVKTLYYDQVSLSFANNAILSAM